MKQKIKPTVTVGTIGNPSPAIGLSAAERVVMPDGNKWIVCWEHRRGHASGHGQPVDKAAAQSAIDKMNVKYPEIKHWMIQA